MQCSVDRQRCHKGRPYLVILPTNNSSRYEIIDFVEIDQHLSSISDFIDSEEFKKGIVKAKISVVQQEKMKTRLAVVQVENYVMIKDYSIGRSNR